MIKIILLVVFMLGITYIINFLKNNVENKETKNTNLPFIKKQFVFDVMSELTLYRLLVETFSDKYYVFPQISYGRLIEVKKEADSWNRNRFDKKIADFVLCDKENAIAKLVIELDGPSHQLKKRIERDEKVDKMMLEIGLPILHLKTANFDKEYLKQEVTRKLSE